MKKAKKAEVVVILHDIRSTHNVGSIFRTADASGVSRVYLSGYTPAPLDQFGRKRKDIAKVSLGAEDTVPWESAKKISVLVQKLKTEGYTVVALEQSEHSLDYKKISKVAGKKIALILGNEPKGIDKKVLAECDLIAEIPMSGVKESLNVSVAFGIAVFKISDI